MDDFQKAGVLLGVGVGTLIYIRRKEKEKKAKAKPAPKLVRPVRVVAAGDDTEKPAELPAVPVGCTPRWWFLNLEGGSFGILKPGLESKSIRSWPDDPYAPPSAEWGSRPNPYGSMLSDPYDDWKDKLAYIAKKVRGDRGNCVDFVIVGEKDKYRNLPLMQSDQRIAVRAMSILQKAGFTIARVVVAPAQLIYLYRPGTGWVWRFDQSYNDFGDHPSRNDPRAIVMLDLDRDGECWGYSWSRKAKELTPGHNPVFWSTTVPSVQQKTLYRAVLTGYPVVLEMHGTVGVVNDWVMKYWDALERNLQAAGYGALILVPKYRDTSDIADEAMPGHPELSESIASIEGQLNPNGRCGHAFGDPLR